MWPNNGWTICECKRQRGRLAGAVAHELDGFTALVMLPLGPNHSWWCFDKPLRVHVATPYATAAVYIVLTGHLSHAARLPGRLRNLVGLSTQLAIGSLWRRGEAVQQFEEVLMRKVLDKQHLVQEFEFLDADHVGDWNGHRVPITELRILRRAPPSTPRSRPGQTAPGRPSAAALAALM
jgi:hypothetical protein